MELKSGNKQNMTTIDEFDPLVVEIKYDDQYATAAVGYIVEWHVLNGTVELTNPRSSSGVKGVSQNVIASIGEGMEWQRITLVFTNISLGTSFIQAVIAGTNTSVVFEVYASSKSTWLLSAAYLTFDSEAFPRWVIGSIIAGISVFAAIVVAGKSILRNLCYAVLIRFQLPLLFIPSSRIALSPP